MRCLRMLADMLKAFLIVMGAMSMGIVIGSVLLVALDLLYELGRML
jgi:hypothetical protein